MYLREEWRYLVRKVNTGKPSAPEAEQVMHAQFDSNPALWNLHDIILQVPPVPLTLLELSIHL